MFAHIKINFIRNKYDCLSDKQKIDLLLVSETKINDSFQLPNSL